LQKSIVKDERAAMSHENGIKFIAQQLNISASTVSRALNGVYGVSAATRRRVEEAAKEIGYVPHLGAKQLVGKGSGLIGVFAPGFEFEASDGFLRYFSMLQHHLNAFGKDVILFSIPFLRYPDNRLAECVESRGLEACIVLPAFAESHPLMQDALRLRVPCVNFEGIVGERCSSVVSGDRSGGWQAGSYLLKLGHRRIGYMNGPPFVRVCRERYEGFLDAHRDFGVAFDAACYAEGDFSGASGAQAAIRIWQSEEGITALYCANDLMAAGAIMELARHQVAVPERLSVIGHDDDVFCTYLNPPLTTIRHSREKLGVRAVEMIMDLLKGESGKMEIVPPQLIERSSAAAIRG